MNDKNDPIKVAPLRHISFLFMIWLVLSIVCSVTLGVLFKLFPKYGIDTFQAIVFNYFTCVVCSTMQNGRFVVQGSGSAPWFWYAILLGFVFITGFTLAAATVRHFSVTISQIMQKMSIVLSVPFAILVYHESAAWLKILGILIAIAAIILVNIMPAATEAQATKYDLKRLAMPFFTWLLAGVIEMVFIIVQKGGMISMGDSAFITTVFFTAGCLGSVVMAWQLMRGSITWSPRNIAAGVLLGIPNYGSMYFLLQGLSSGMESSVFFPLNNMGIILLTVLLAVFIFRDRLTKINLIGVGLTMVALFLITR
jgi:drug/metabolite transporter (DMT)-like permease